jgi:linoleoyl-CoA desaturase
MLAHAVEKVEFPTLDESGMTENNWFIHQLKTTANFATNSKLAAFISGGLNQQVEHHLFPNICSTHYPALANIVRETAKEYGVDYHEYPSFWAALRSHTRFMKLMGNPNTAQN